MGYERVIKKREKSIEKNGQVSELSKQRVHRCPPKKERERDK
jgi:hypothetical protein